MKIKKVRRADFIKYIIYFCLLAFISPNLFAQDSEKSGFTRDFSALDPVDVKKVKTEPEKEIFVIPKADEGDISFEPGKEIHDKQNKEKSRFGGFFLVVPHSIRAGFAICYTKHRIASTVKLALQTLPNNILKISLAFSPPIAKI